jgi:hypothetical protein
MSALPQRLAARRGKTRAIMAAAHSIVVSAFHRLSRQEPYRELGATYFDEHRREHVIDRLTRRLPRVSREPRTPTGCVILYFHRRGAHGTIHTRARAEADGGHLRRMPSHGAQPQDMEASSEPYRAPQRRQSLGLLLLGHLNEGAVWPAGSPGYVDMRLYPVYDRSPLLCQSCMLYSTRPLIKLFALILWKPFAVPLGWGLLGTFESARSTTASIPPCG